MNKATRTKNRFSSRPALNDLVSQSLREERTVELAHGDVGYALVVDGITLAEIPFESFNWPLEDIRLDEEAVAFANDCLERQQEYNRKRRFERRKRKLRTDDHAASEGATVL